MPPDVSSPSSLASTLTGADACISNYVFRMILASIPMAVVLVIFTRYVQIEREKRSQDNLHIATDLLITTLIGIIALVIIRMVFATWEYFGIPISKVYETLGFYGSNSKLNNQLIPDISPSLLGINICPADNTGSSITHNYVHYLNLGLSIVVFASKLTLYFLPIFIFLAIIYRSFNNVLSEMKSRQISNGMGILSILKTGMLGAIAIAFLTYSAYSILYVDYNTLIQWARSVIFHLK